MNATPEKIAEHIVRYSSLTTAELVRQVQIDRLSTTTRIQMLDEIARREEADRAYDQRMAERIRTHGDAPDRLYDPICSDF